MDAKMQSRSRDVSQLSKNSFADQISNQKHASKNVNDPPSVNLENKSLQVNKIYLEIHHFLFLEYQ